MTALLIFSIAFALASFALFASASHRRPPQPVEAPPENAAEEIGRWPYFRSALAIRLLAAILIRATGMSDFFAPDRGGYEGAGRLLAARWSGNSLTSLEMLVGEANFHHYANGLSFYLGLGPWLILIGNCILGA